MAFGLATLSFGQTSDEAKALQKSVADFRLQTSTDARNSGNPLSPQDLKAKVDAKIAELLTGIDPTKIEAKHALEWARVFDSAGRYQDCCDLAKKFLETNPTDKDKFQAMLVMARACNALGEADMLSLTLNDIPVPDSGSSMIIGNMTANVFVDTIYEKKGLEAAIGTLNTIESKIVREDPLEYAKRMLVAEKARKVVNPSAKPKTDEERLKELEAQGVQANDNQIFTIVNSKSNLYQKAGKTKDAVDVLTVFLGKLDAASPVHRRAKMALTQLTLESNLAPAVVSERSYGEYKGLESLKGKVVIVDFFAHWCGPCIASFPDMQQLYSDWQEKGLEVVAVTTYYGYYRKENVEKRDMAKDVEFAKMGEFIAEYKLPWPVVYGERANFEAYGISGIPTTVVIGRDGTVHKLHVGYSKESFKAFREEIEKLLIAD